MQRRKLGGLEVSAVGLGCATMTPFYDEPDGDAANDTVRRAREIGIDFLDSSDAYGQGRNEELIARAVKGSRNEYAIASKFGNLRAADGSLTSAGRPEYVKACCERSLKRLETDLIDLYYIHRVDPTVPIEDTMGAMGELVRQGKVRHLGICEAGAATIRRAHATHPLSAVQIEYSLWTRDVEAEILPLREELGIGFVAYSPLGRGFLTGNVANIAALRAGDVRRNMPRFQGDNLRHNLGLVEELKSTP
jgi:aryl-alcohol dehydrogenase-like predicted oxidoreductase